MFLRVGFTLSKQKSQFTETVMYDKYSTTVDRVLPSIMLILVLLLYLTNRPLTGPIRFC